MATGNLLLGQASGAVGSLVFARANGQQVTKARQELVRYSNTLAQAIQRICISTAGQAYRHMKEVCCRSFQGIQPGKATHDEFMKRNVRLLRQRIRQADAQGLTYSDLRYFTPVGNDTMLPNAYIVSSGSLPTITSNIISNDPTHARLAGVGSSYQDIISFYGLQRGDILTFVFMQPDTSGIVRARSARVVLDPRSPMGDLVSLDVPFIAAGNLVNYPNPNNSGEFTYLVSDSGGIVYSLVNSAIPLIAAGVFASRRTEASSWLHSDCQLSLYSDSDILDMFTLQQAIDVANGAPIAAISTDYLNNAGTIRLPQSPSYIYEILDYLGSSETQFINTNIVPNDKFGFKAIIDIEDVITNLFYIGVRKDSQATRISWGVSNGYTWVGWGAVYPSAAQDRPAIQAKVFNTIELNFLNNRKFAFNNQIIEENLRTLAFENTNNLYLFAFNYTSISGRTEKIKEFIISNDNNIIAHYIPVRRIADGELGMYDKITDTFKTNEGSGQFIPGQVIGYL